MTSNVMTRQDLVRRLSLIRHLYGIGERQSNEPLPYSAIAILSFHDCLEWFLITACEFFSIDTRKSAGLLEYYSNIQEKGQLSPTGKMTLNRIASARNELKHRLTLPSTIAVRDAQVSTKVFLEDNSDILFSVNFCRVSMIDLIITQNVQENLNEASCLIEDRKYHDAMRALHCALNELGRTFQFNLRPHWAMLCGVDEFVLRHVFSHFEQGDANKTFPIEPTERGCRLIHEWMLETVISVEQRFLESWQRIKHITGDPHRPFDPQELPFR
jgi:hypothetical protein